MKIEIKIAASAFKEYNRLNELAKAAKKAADAQWEKFSLPATGKEWAEMAGIKSGETATVTLFDLSGKPLAAGIVSERITPPQPEKIVWISPRL
jgi:hypothetical protein